MVTVPTSHNHHAGLEADGMQAWKIVIPTSKVDPEPRSHEG
jgi:hypothetical protein